MNNQLNDVATRGEQLEAQLQEDARALATFYRELRTHRVPVLLAAELTMTAARLRFRALFEPACPVRREKE